jgi:hypothetical protein
MPRLKKIKVRINFLKGKVRKMNPMPGKCPVCNSTMHVTRLQCGQCGTGIDGTFALGRLQALTPEQIQFVETFLRNKGKIKDVEAELDISYPTVVARLNDVVRAMGFDAEAVQLSDVDQYEFYEARIINPSMNPGGPIPPTPPVPPVAPIPPGRPAMPASPPPQKPKLTQEQRQQILDDLAAGKITMSEAMSKLNG